eukprot:4287820-Pleurochrysis_carterae.AAC.1
MCVSTPFVNAHPHAFRHAACPGGYPERGARVLADALHPSRHDGARHRVRALAYSMYPALSRCLIAHSIGLFDPTFEPIPKFALVSEAAFFVSEAALLGSEAALIVSEAALFVSEAAFIVSEAALFVSEAAL